LRQKFVRLRGDNHADTRLSYDLISIDRVPMPPGVAEAAGWNPEMEMLKVVQLVRFGGAGVGREVSHLPLAKLPNFQKHMTFGQDLYPLLADYGIIVTGARERLSVTTSSDIAEDLGAQDGSPIVRLTRIAYCIEKIPVEYRVSYYLAGGFNYDIEIV
jgi:DNA-binding GntR family transcriptional regulator